jgi:hypothetical protein
LGKTSIQMVKCPPNRAHRHAGLSLGERVLALSSIGEERMKENQNTPVLKEAQLVLQRVKDQLAPHPEWAEAVEELDTVLRQLEDILSDARPSNGAHAFEIIQRRIDILKVLKEIAEFVLPFL